MSEELKNKYVKELGDELSALLQNFFKERKDNLNTQLECEISVGVVAAWLQTLVGIFEDKDNQRENLLENIKQHVINTLKAKESANGNGKTDS